MTSGKMKQLLALVVVLVACIAFYAWFSSYKEKEQEKEDEKNTVKTETILKLDKKNLISLNYKYNDKEYLVNYDSKNDKCKIKGKEKWPFNQDTLRTMISSVESISSERTMESTDKSEYGLDKPSKKVIVKTKEDDKEKTYKLLFGNTAPNEAGYYFMVDGEDKIYVVSSTVYDAFEYDDMSLLRVELVDSVNSSLVYDVDIVSKDFVLKAKYDGKIQDGDGRWIISKPYPSKQKGVTSIFTEYFVNYESLAYDKCVAYKPKDLGKYGLKNPKFRVDLKYYEEVASEDESDDSKKSDDKDEAKASYNKKTLSLLIGKEVKEDYEGELTTTGYYVMPEGGDRVYVMESSMAESIMNNTAFAFVDATINGTDLLQYENVKIETSKKTYNFKKESKSVEGDDGKSTVEYTYKVNGKKIDTAKGDSIGSALFNLSYSGEIGKKKHGNGEVAVTFTFEGKKDGAKDTVIKLKNFDGVNYKVNKDGEEIFIVSKESISGFLDLFD